MADEFTDIAEVDSDEEEKNISKPPDIPAEVSETKEEENEQNNSNDDDNDNANIPSVFFNCTQQIKLKQKLMQLVDFYSWIFRLILKWLSRKRTLWETVSRIRR